MLGDKDYAGREFEQPAAELDATMVRPAERTNPVAAAPRPNPAGRAGRPWRTFRPGRAREAGWASSAGRTDLAPVERCLPCGQLPVAGSMTRSWPLLAFKQPWMTPFESGIVARARPALTPTIT